MNTKITRVSLFMAGITLIAVVVLASFGSYSSPTYAAAPRRGPMAIDTPTLQPTPTSTRTGGDDVIKFADPYVIKAADVAQVEAGGTIVFTIIASNRGNTDAVNVQVRDTLPSHLDLVEVTASPRGTVIINGRSILVDIGTLAPNEVITIKVTARANSTMTPGQCTNIATLNTTSGGDNPNNNASFGNYICGEVVNPPTGGSQSEWPTLVLLLAGLAMIVASFVIGHKKVS